jgi:5-methylcytosine-specific restriction endonuclease McrA
MKGADFYASREWREFRIKVLARFESRCFACGRTPAHGVALHVDHIQPRYLYPDRAFDPENMQILCEDCNLGKGAKKVKPFVILRRRAKS